MVGINNFKKADMKKIFIFLILSVAMVSCYKDYIKDFDYTGVYFTYQVDTRTVVVGEGMKIEIGAELGGTMHNSFDRIIPISVQDSMVTAAKLTLMKAGPTYMKNAVTGVAALSPLPSTYYSLSDNSKIVIKTGSMTGSIVFTADSANFLADAATINAQYALGLYIGNIDKTVADTVLPKKRWTVVGIKYENMLFGYYWHGGVTTIDSAGTPLTPLVYPTTIPTPDNTIWSLTTIAPNVLVTNAYGKNITNKKEITLTLGSAGAITIGTGATATNTYLPANASTFNQAKVLEDRRIILSYQWVIGVKTYTAQDTLTFRNRIRDGVDEWQGNPSLILK
jgi:hypothetical protein